MRTGILVQKIGMQRLFTKDGRQIPVTVLALDSIQVIAQRRPERDGYCAVQIGAGSIKPKNVTKPMRLHFAAAQSSPKRKLVEFRVSPANLVDVGAEITADHFVVGQRVDVSGVSIGKGFAGAMKRHNFGGLRATHGVSVSHRSHGSTGQCQNPGRVFKGKKMAGQLGNARTTIQNLEVVKIDLDKGFIFVKGAVPGAKGGWLTVRDSVKKNVPENVPFPAAFKPNQPNQTTPTESDPTFAAAKDNETENAQSGETP